jgi:capsular polysaccharide transport system ATP-binding protein
MIDFYDVTLEAGRGRTGAKLLDRYTGRIEPGAYVLLCEEPRWREVFLRLCAGQMTPQSGIVARSGPVSWPIGNPAPLISTIDGIATARFFATIYELEPDDVIAYLEDYGGLSEADLAQPLRGLSFAKFQKFALSLALLPNFDIYLAEGSLIIPDQEFTDRWIADFRTRIKGKVFILITSQINAIRRMCDSALVLTGGQAFVARDVGRAVETYGLRPGEFVRPAQPLALDEDSDDGIG